VEAERRNSYVIDLNSGETKFDLLHGPCHSGLKTFIDVQIPQVKRRINRSIIPKYSSSKFSLLFFTEHPKFNEAHYRAIIERVVLIT